MDTSHNCVNCLRLTSALGAAHEVIGKILDDTSDWVDSSTYRRFVDDYKAKEVFQDKSGSLAFEKWKALQNTKQEYDKAMNVCLDKFSNQKFGSVADCLNGIFEKWKKMEAVEVKARKFMNDFKDRGKYAPLTDRDWINLCGLLEALDAKGGA